MTITVQFEIKRMIGLIWAYVFYQYREDLIASLYIREYFQDIR